MRRLAMLALLVASGCAMVGPDYKRPETSLPAKYGESAPEGALKVPFDWWKVYNDPLLDKLIQDGLEHNTDLYIAIARVDEAQGALKEAHAILFFPPIDLNVQAARGRTTSSGTLATGSGFAVGLSTSFEVDVWGRLRRGVRSVNDQLLASEYGRDTVALTVAAQVARAYFAVRGLDAQLIASRSILEAADQSLSLAKKRAGAGIAPDLDIYQAGSLRAQSSAQASEIQRQRATFVHALGVLTGHLDLQIEPGTFNAIPIPPVTPPGLPSELLERRPDVRQAEMNLEAATERIGVAKGSEFPALSLTGTYGSIAPQVDQLFSTAARTWSIGAGLTGPILDGGRYRARTEQAEAQAREAQGAYESAVRNAFRDVVDAISNVKLASDTEVDLRDLVDQSQKALHLAEVRYEHGYSAYLEVLDAQRTLNDAQLTLIRNRVALLSYTVDLMNALGGGWEPPKS
ncbi:MAG TPA: efflux transporter outer membrane subunit [Usitatibacter sp.]|nr:efflux transporter outer membrane subunit [Usitatibacter sp.]